MILNKQVAVFLNIVHFRFKQYINSIFSKYGFNLTPEQYLVMDTLWDDGVLSQQELADRLCKDKNSVTKLIDALEKKNLVKRVPDEADRRLNMIHFTDHSLTIKDRITEIAIESTNRIIRDIPEDELKILVKVLLKMEKNMDE